MILAGLLATVPVLLGGAGARLSRFGSQRLAPQAATVLLTLFALTVALATGLLLCLAGLVSVGELAPALTLHHWSPGRLRHLIPVPPEFGVITGLIATALFLSAGRHLLQVTRQLRRSWTTASRLTPAGDDLVLLQDASPIAYALPGRRGRIVVSTGLLRTLSAAERRALLAHEESHLRHRHHLYVQLGRLAAAANPLVRPIAAAIELAVERWADESAAAELGDRATVARAVARAARAGASPVPALALAETDVVTRVRILLQPTRPRRLVALGYAGAIVGCWLSAFLVIRHVHQLMELAEVVSRRR